MGRRANPLVVEFFDRGAKLEDNSNRYQHTCKRCGELFPKGRVDSLVSHLLRKCPNVGPDDRDWVFREIRQSPDRRSNRKASSKTPPDHQQLQQPQSALDTLAEVSRHHLDYSTQQGQADGNLHECLTEQALLAQLQQHAARSPQVGSTEPLQASPLVQTASAASRRLEEAQDQNWSPPPDASLVDPQLNEMGGPIRRRSVQRDGIDVQRIGTEQVPQSSSSAPSAHHSFGGLSMASNELTPGFGLLQKPAKSKARGRFNDIRRKQVQEIRKRGACIRCRMLKKSCSEGTPCSQCSNVESARLWKGTCLRTRLAEEFSLWSTGLFHATAKIDVSTAISGLRQSPIPGRIDARFFANSDLCLSLNAKIHAVSLDGIDPALEDGTAFWLIDEDDSICDKIESYAANAADACIEVEQSAFIKATLQQAQTLIRSESAESAAKSHEVNAQQSPRTCYNLQNQLLKNVIELWVQTQLLTMSSQHALELRVNPGEASSQGPYSGPWTQPNEIIPVKSIPESSASYRLIEGQLLAAVESRGSKLSKVVMNELERRFLQRQQVSRFATYLSTVILLNSVERMTGLYRGFDDSNGLASAESSDSTYESISALHAESSSGLEMASDNFSHRLQNNATAWPLETSPAELWSQGAHFSDLLTMLLRMRALPPKTSHSPDGTLVAAQDYALPVQMNGRPIKEQIEEQTKTVAAWLDPLKLKVSELVRKRDGPFPDKDEGIDTWDMKFIAKVLLPERMK